MNIFKKEGTIFDKVENRILDYIKGKSLQIIKEDTILLIKNIGKLFIGVIICTLGINGVITNSLLSLKALGFISLGVGLFFALVTFLILKNDYYPIYKIAKNITNINDKYYYKFLRLIWAEQDKRINKENLLLTEEEIKEILKLKLNHHQLNLLKKDIEINGILTINGLMEIKDLVKIEEEKSKEEEKKDKLELEKKENLLMFFEKYNLTHQDKSLINGEEDELELTEKKLKQLL